MYENTRFLTAIKAFQQVSNNTEEMIEVFQRHSELLNEDIDTAFELEIAKIREQGNLQAAKILEKRHNSLKNMRPELKKGFAQQDAAYHVYPMVQQAEAAESAYLSGQGVVFLNNAITAWELVLQNPVFTETEDEFRLRVINNSANTYLQRYWARGNLNDLSTAIEYWENSISTSPPNYSGLPDLFNNLGNGFTNRYTRLGNIKDLQLGINAYEKAIENTPVDSLDLASRLNNLGIALNNRYSHLAQLDDLHASIAAFQKSVEMTFDDSPTLPGHLSNLATGLRKRYAHLGHIIDLQKSVEAYQKAVTKIPADSPDLARHLNNLGNGLRDRYSRLGRLEDLQESVQHYQQAVLKVPKDSADLPAYLSNLGNSFIDSYARSGNLKDLQAGIDYHRKAIAKTPPDSSVLPIYFNNLSNGLSERYTSLGKLDDMNESIEYHQKAVSNTPSTASNLHTYLNNLATGLNTRYMRLGKLEDLQASIAIYQKTITKTPSDSPDLASHLNNLATAFMQCYAHSGEAKDLLAGQTAFRQSMACSQGSSSSSELTTARNCINWSFQYKFWQEIEQAYTYAQQASEKLLKAQATRTDKEAWLKDMQGIAAQAAFAFAKLDKPEQAALTLEQGSARLLSETLALNHADIEALRDSPQSKLHQAYFEALTAYQNAQHIQKPGIQQQALRDAWKNLDAVIAQIRQVEGFEKFLQPASFAEIEQAAEQPLLYLAVTVQGGVGIFVQREDMKSAQCSVFFLPQLDETNLREHLSAYLKAYQQRDQDNMAWGLWEARLAKLCHWLGEIFLTPLRQALPDLRQVTLIPLGLLGLLPLHAATDSERSALDDWCITYAPNARSLNRARQIQAKTSSQCVLAIENPKRNIHYAAYATESLRKHCPQTTVYQHATASHDKVFNALPHYDIIHFYCHSKTNTEQPLRSLLELADDNLHLKTLLAKGKLKARLVLLCACETGMLADLQRAEESVSLSTGLLQAGSAAVIASLWSVRDDSTMILISHFYYLWQREQLEPAEALRQAQIWLRDSVPQQRVAFFQELLPEAAVVKLEAVLMQDFSHPYHWAGFGLIGV
jgi:CHAT domain-containing protein